jgi:hypothetical protein
MTDLAKVYIRLAREWSSAMEGDESNEANALHDQIQTIYEALSDKDERDTLYDLATTETDGVQLFVASHMRTHDVIRAISIYERLEKSPVAFVAISAKYILREMKK